MTLPPVIYDLSTSLAGTSSATPNLPDLDRKLQDTPNLLMWTAGHRQLNTVKALPAYSDEARTQLMPEKSFWQVETSSLQHFPQQFRTFEIYINEIPHTATGKIDEKRLHERLQGHCWPEDL